MNNNNDLNGKQSITIYDVAREAGVAPSTVNRALNNVGRVSKETRERVRDIAARLGYSPSFVARSLRNSRTKTLGVVVTILGETFSSSMVHGIESVAYERGYNIIVCTSECNNQRENRYYDLLCERRVEGIITVPTAPFDSEEPFKKLLDIEDRGVPVVVLEQDIPEQRLSKVVMDNYGAAKEITQHLISLGHKRIGLVHIGMTSWNYSGASRMAGYKAALTEAGLDTDDVLVEQLTRDVMNPFDESPLDVPFLSYYERAKPTAIFAIHDTLAIKVMHICENAGIRVPDDLAVVGFDDMLTAAFTSPPLTTIRQPSIELGERAAESLFRRIEGKQSAVVHEKILGQLVVRASCGAKLRTKLHGAVL